MESETLLAKLKNQFVNVRIKRTDLDLAERRMRGELIDKWEESVS